MIEQLFGSKTRVKLLRLFYGNPNRSFYVREITRKIDEQINSVRRELANLLSIGIISSETTNNRLYYEVNQEYEYYQPLSAIFSSGSKASKVKDKVSQTDQHPLVSLGNVSVAIYTGHFTRDESSGVDILIVGNVNQSKVLNFITDVEAEENKEIRYVVMPLQEFEYRRQIKDRFISDILNSKKQVIIDKNNLVEPK
ncbi:MAG TPA: transcriptional regulator [Candidatus Saccharimonadales bacterium]|jgi:predicted transcriptional regulator|nr:transcriptional regulator [Candidatus Saccharimonadales bacterium]